MNKIAIETSIKMLLKDGFGVDYENTEGMQDTPKRTAKYWMELLEGMQYTNDEIVEMFKDKLYPVDIDSNVIVTDIPVFSHCEHHLALMYDMFVSIKYTSKGKVIGLSKINRICNLVCKRLQLQERITTDIQYILEKLLGVSVKVQVKGKHSCVTARGIKSNSYTYTGSLDGEI